MIVTALENLGTQVFQTSAMRKGLAWLRENHANSALPERVEIAGKEVYALVQSYETAVAGEEVRLEAHQNYIDIQYIVSGVEMMGWAPLDALYEATPYNPEKDVFHGLVPVAQLTPLLVRAGYAAVFYPEDAHAPKLAAGRPRAVKKIVVKVRVG